MGQPRKRPSAQTEGLGTNEKLTRTKHENNNRSEKKGNPSQFLTWALRYAKHGFPVFPCEPRGKAPEGKLAPNGFKDATTDPRIIKRWWCNGHDYNIGLVPPKGMAILDIDPRNGGERSWEKIQQRLGSNGVVLRSKGLRAFTGGGGEHIILDGVPDRLPGKLAKGIDVKRNGYVIAEPSIHPDTGKRYRWIGGWQPGKIRDWPSDLKPIRVEKAPGEKRGQGGDLTPSQLKKLLKKIDPDDYDDWISVGQALKADYPEEGFDLWISWSAKSKKFPGERMARTKWRSFRRDDRRTGTLVHMAGGKVPRTSAKEDFPGEEEDPAVAKEIADGKQDKAERKGLLTLVNGAGAEEKQIDWLVPGYLAKGMLHCVAGYGGEGKSNVVAAIMAALSKGKDIVTGKKLADGKCRTLMVTEEPIAYQTIPRLRLAGADLRQVDIIQGVMEKNEKGKKRTVSWNLQDHLGQVRSVIQARPEYKLMVIDPIGSYMTGKKRDVDTWKDSDVRDVLRPWQELAEQLNIAVLFIAHFNKGKSARAAEKVTGAAAFTTTTRITYLVGKPGADWLEGLGVEPAPEGSGDRVMVSIKRNIGADPPPLVFGVDRVEGEDCPRVHFKTTLDIAYAKDAEVQIMGDGANSGGPGKTQREEALELIEGEPGITSSKISAAIGSDLANTNKVLNALIAGNQVVRMKKGREVHWYIQGHEFEDNEDLLS